MARLRFHNHLYAGFLSSSSAIALTLARITASNSRGTDPATDLTSTSLRSLFHAPWLGSTLLPVLGVLTVGLLLIPIFEARISSGGNRKLRSALLHALLPWQLLFLTTWMTLPVGEKIWPGMHLLCWLIAPKLPGVAIAGAVLLFVRSYWLHYATAAMSRFGSLLHRHLPATGATLALGIAVTATSINLPRMQPAGDEPHYLRIASSLYMDGDVNLANNVPGYNVLWPEEWCHLHHIIPDGHDGCFSIHNPGLPALIAIPVAWFGRPGFAALFNLLFALLVAEILRIVPLFSVSTSGTLFSAGLVLASPLLFFSYQCYPELPAALLTIFCLRLILTFPGKPSALFLISVCAGLLPFLHIKYALLSLLLTTALLVRKPRALIAPWFWLPAAGCAVALFSYYAGVSGQWNPFLLYRRYSQPAGAFDRTLIRGLFTHLLDRNHGLLLYFPGFLAATLSCPNRPPNLRRCRLLLLVLLPYLLMVASHASLRWLGFAPPARFLIPILPLAAILAGCGWDRLHEAERRILIAWLGINVVTTSGFVLRAGWLLERHKLLDQISPPQTNLSVLLPQSTLTLTPRSLLQFATLLLILLLPLLLTRIQHHLPVPHPDNSGALWLITLLLLMTITGSGISILQILAPPMATHVSNPTRIDYNLAQCWEAPPKSSEMSLVKLLESADTALAKKQPWETIRLLHHALRKSGKHSTVRCLLSEAYRLVQGWEQMLPLLDNLDPEQVVEGFNSIPRADRLGRRMAIPELDQQLARWIESRRMEALHALIICYQTMAGDRRLELHRRQNFEQMARQLAVQKQSCANVQAGER